jgi:hypothetical protein
VLLVLLASACGFLPDDPSDDCEFRPLKEAGLFSSFGPPVAAATTCAPLVLIDGERYTYGGPDAWLDEAPSAWRSSAQ